MISRKRSRKNIHSNPRRSWHSKDWCTNDRDQLSGYGSALHGARAILRSSQCEQRQDRHYVLPEMERTGTQRRCSYSEGEDQRAATQCTRQCVAIAHCCHAYLLPPDRQEPGQQGTVRQARESG